jgi:hypothetical protein
MFKINSNLQKANTAYKTPTYLLNTENNYAPFLRLIKREDYTIEITIQLRELIDILELVYSSMEELDSNIEESIALELLTLRQTEPLKIEYEDFKNIPNFINVLEFEDPEITNLYNELLVLKTV